MFRLITLFFLFHLPYTWTAWDVSIAVTNGVHLAIEDNGTLVPVRKIPLNGPYHRPTRPLVYDPRNDLLYVSGTIYKNETTVHCIHLSSGETEKITIIDSIESGSATEQILGIEHDYIKNILYWTNGPGGKILMSDLNIIPRQQTILYNTHDLITSGLALDECSRTIYWTSYILGEDVGYIESLNLDSKEHSTLHLKNLHNPTDLTIDQVAKKMYWCDVKAGSSYTIERSDLDGSARDTVIAGNGVQPTSLALTTQYVYWINIETEKIERTEKATKKKRQDKILDYEPEKPRSIVSYKSILQCASKFEIKPYQNNSSNMTESKFSKEKDIGRDMYTTVSNVGMCLNGGTREKNDQITLDQEMKCICPAKFHGQFCDKCDYCLNGNCTKGSNNSIRCTCNEGYNGSRCEHDICFNYCLNGGQCSIGNQSEPLCDCTTAIGNYHGSRCEIDCNLFCQNNPSSGIYVSGKPICSCVGRIYVTNLNNANASLLAEEQHNNMEMQLRFGLIGVGGLCIILFIATVWLIKSVIKLRKRPRIKKRIIVNKNVTPTPLTCRPSPGGEQCEITIENCCNMNICETPCYEPQLRTSDKSVSKTEEKKNLLGNMEGESGSASQDTLY